MDEPSDAFELGQVAAEKLREQDNEVSQKLPSALANLFGDEEFKKAIGGSGIITTQPQTLTPLASYHVSKVGFINRSPVLNRPFVLLSPTSRTPLNTDEEFSLHIHPEIFKPIPIRDAGEHNEELESRTSENPKNWDSDNEEVAEHCDTLSMPDLDGAELSGAEFTCLICGAGTFVADQKRFCYLKNFFASCLNLTKVFEESDNVMGAFCYLCLNSVQKLDRICHEIQSLKDQFSNVRDTLCEKFVAARAHQVSKSTSLHSTSVQTRLISAMRQKYYKVTPCCDLLPNKNSKSFPNTSEGLKYTCEPNSLLSSGDVSKSSETATLLSESLSLLHNAQVGKSDICPVPSSNLSGSGTSLKHNVPNNPDDGNPSCSGPLPVVPPTLICHVCSENFSSLSTLKNHDCKLVVCNRDGKKYDCSYCDKTFKYKHSLREHVLRHQGRSPLKCKLCGAGFFRSGQLKRHEQRRHSADNPKDLLVRKIH